MSPSARDVLAQALRASRLLRYYNSSDGAFNLSGPCHP